MAALAKPKSKLATAKKPTTKSKTGRSECSSAASNWQLSLRGKAALDPGTYQTLAKCRSLAKTQKMADGHARTGKLSEQGKSALQARAQKRFDSGLITQKSREERLRMLLKQRAERSKQSQPAPATEKKVAPGRGTEKRAVQAEYLRAVRKGSAYEVSKSLNKLSAMPGGNSAKYHSDRNFIVTEGPKGGSISVGAVQATVKSQLRNKLAKSRTRANPVGRHTPERSAAAKAAIELRRSNVSQATEIAKKSGMVAIPSKFDTTRVAVKEDRGWVGYTPRQLAYKAILKRTKSSGNRLAKLKSRANS